MTSLLNLTLPILNDFQKKVYDECIEKTGGYGLSLPMGSGKSILSILIGLAKTLEHDPILVVVSKTLVLNWKHEIEKFFGDKLKYHVFHQDSCDINTYVLDPLVKLVITTPEVVCKFYSEMNIRSKFCNYRMVNQGRFNQHVIVEYNRPTFPFTGIQVTPTTNQTVLIGGQGGLPPPFGGNIIFGKKWGYLIIDEIQKFTKISSKRAQGLGAICAVNRLAMSGTVFDEPVIERILGYHIIIDCPVFPRTLPSATLHVKSRHFHGIENKENFVTRAKNEAFIPPGVNEKIISHSLSRPELIIYQMMKSVTKEINMQVKRFKNEDDSENVRKFNSYLLAMITYLRQCIVSPLVPISKLAIDLLDFSGRSELSKILNTALEKENLSSWLNNPESVKSSRIEKALSVLSEHQEEKVVIFTCFRTCLLVFMSQIPETRPKFTLSATQSVKGRQQTLKDFSETENGVLVVTYDLGGEGLNLQFSHTVMLLDLWWNDGKTQQAIARILRYGQESNHVNVYFFTSNTGLENSIFRKQKDKLTVLEEIRKGPLKSNISKMNVKDIIKIISEDENINLLNHIRHR